MERFRRALGALGVRFSDDARRRVIFILILFAAGTILPGGTADAATLSSASVALTDTQPSVTANYNFTASSFTGATSLKCIQEVYSTVSDGSGGVPSGMVTSGTSLDASTNLVTAANWSLVAGSSSGTVAYHDSTGQTPGTTTAAKFNVDGFTNSNTPTTSGYWMTFSTWTGDSSGGVCTGTETDSTVVGFNITTGSSMTMAVNPTLTTSVTGVSASTSCDGSTTTVGTTAGTIPFGTVTASANSLACQELSAGTNATNGYTLFIRQSGPLINQSAHNFTAVSGSNSVPVAFPAVGTEAYGYTTSSSTLSTCSGSCNANRFTDGSTYNDYSAYTTTNSEIGYSATGSASTNYFIGHQVGSDLSTPAGNYTTTIIYTCTPIF